MFAKRAEAERKAVFAEGFVRCGKWCDAERCLNWHVKTV
jgi:hypothetical protein